MYIILSNAFKPIAQVSTEVRFSLAEKKVRINSHFMVFVDSNFVPDPFFHKVIGESIV